MLPDETEELRVYQLDAQRAFRRIAKALGVERSIPATSAGLEELAALVEGNSAAYLIQDTRSFVGNSALFWRSNGQGYTCDLDQAGHYTKEEAERQERSRPTDKAVPLTVALKVAERHVPSDALHRALNPPPEEQG
ncbi:hypothetical protein Rctr197k_274 [Virus Rctr197k]|nr:hypothetical protein Rctr197k_274 [Virus Rctr197k]